MPFELSWRPGGSVGFLFEFLGIFGLTMVVVKGREEIAISSPSPDVEMDVDAPEAGEVAFTPRHFSSFNHHHG